MGANGGEELMQGPPGCEDRIFVSVRLRPLNQKEIARNDVSDWECINNDTIIYRNTLSVSERSMYPTACTFDRVFSCDCSTRKVYEEGAKKVALSVISGINSTVFAYGQTSSGKTYTMSGITEYTVADIYAYIDKHLEREFFLKFSAMEIYNESVRDLLSADSTPLRLLDDPERGTIVEKLTEETLRDWNHFKGLLSICEAQRQVGETSLNEASSRSHQILRLTIESSTREFSGNDKSSFLTATVNFVDLAGSERASQSLSAGTRLKEGCHINRSLLTLGTVIRKLSKGRNGHVPFRDSKLTRILQSSLGGNARTAIICTMSPARSHVEQSRNTLLFASCAKEVMTNAKVNIVVSDKALVKQLQRELARLESELRSSGLTPMPDSAALLREQDFLIGKLKEELKEVSLQRDLAQSQVKDLLRKVEDDKPAIASTNWDDHYPKLRVRSSWDFENHVSTVPSLTDNQCPDVDVGSFDASQYSDGARSNASEVSSIQHVDLAESFPQTPSSVQLSVRTPISENETRHEEIEENLNDNIDDFCKEVRCIEMEDTSASFSPNIYNDSNVSSPVENTAVASILKAFDNDRGSCELVIPYSQADKETNNFNSIFSVPSPEKASPWLLEKDDFSCGGRGMELTRSRSCKASLMTTLSSRLIENIVNNESTPPTWCEKSFAGRPESFSKKLPALNYGSEFGALSRNDSRTSVRSVVDNEINVTASTEKMANAQYINTKLADNMEHETELEQILFAKNVKNVGLDPIQNDIESPLKWLSEFKTLQRDIIELWHTCNVSLVHRTYFFLLFRGDPSDSIYMEVELRRLSFLRDIFTRKNQTVDDTPELTPTSSTKKLCHERQMLSSKMQKRLSKQDRETLFVQWGIGLNSTHRKLQLAYRLWTDTKDMDHIRESATVVAKLVGYIEPEHAFKEMFGLNFTPALSGQRFHRWILGLKTLF